MTRRLPRMLGTLALLGLLAGSAARAQPEIDLAVEILVPDGREAIFGPQELSAAVRSSAEVESVVFRFDGEVVAELTTPPWRVRVDAGEENRQHRIEVVVRAGGGRATATRITPAIEIHDRTELRLHQVYVTATHRGERIRDLRRDELTVTDDGVAQTIVTFEDGEIPFTAVVLVDGSRSMEGAKMRAALAGVEAFVRAMKKDDLARLVIASDRIQRTTPFLDRDGDLLALCAGVEARGATVLYDTLFLALESLESHHGRRVVILLSDGEDTHSMLRMDEVREVARASRSIVYWIRLTRPGDVMPRTTWRAPEVAEANLEDLMQTVEETGGRILDSRTAEAMGSAFQEILAELREQYALGYYPDPPGAGERWRRIDVDVDRRGVELRYRDRYLDRRPAAARRAVGH